MKIWLDNTGLHSAGRCLTGEAYGESDVEGLLQLSTLIVFGSSLHVNGFESSSIAEYTQHVSQVIEEETGFSELNIEPSPSYKIACRDAGDRSATQLQYGIETTVSAIQDVVPSGVKSEDISAQTNLVREIIYGKFDRDLIELEEEAFLKKAVGAFDLMIATSSDLRRAIALLGEKKSDWTPNELYMISVACRYYLNEVLAEQINCIPAPAVGRSRMIVRRNRDIIDSIQSDIDEVATTLARHPIGAPSVMSSLVKKSKGDPRGVIPEALLLRDKFQKAIQNYENEWNSLQGGTIMDSSQRDQLSSTVRNALRRELGIDPKTSLLDGVNITLFAGLAPVLTLDAKVLRNWWKEKRDSRKFSVLTDAIRGATINIKKSREWRNLIETSARNS